MPIFPIYRESLFPHWNEWVVFIWLSGLLLSQLTSPQDLSGLGMIKYVIILLNIIAVGIHGAAFFVDREHWPLLIYIRNQFSGLSLLCCCVQILDFLSFHYLFGPWAIIISSLMIDLGKFLTILVLFQVSTLLFLYLQHGITSFHPSFLVRIFHALHGHERALLCVDGNVSRHRPGCKHSGSQ